MARPPAAAAGIKAPAAASHPRPLAGIRPDAAFYSTAFTHGIFNRTAAPGPADRKPRYTAMLTPPAAGSCCASVEPSIHPDETLAIASAGLDNWQRIVPLDDTDFPVWMPACDLPAGCANTNC